MPSRKILKNGSQKNVHVGYVGLLYLKFKGVLSGLREVLAIECPLKMMKKGLYCTLKAVFVLEIFRVLF